MEIPDSFRNAKPGQVFFISDTSAQDEAAILKSIQGAIHLKDGQFLPVTDLNLIVGQRPDALSVIKTTFEGNPKPENIIDVVMGMEPELSPVNQAEFDEAKAAIKAFMDECWKSKISDGVQRRDRIKSLANWEEVFVAMLDEAVELSRLGKNVIIHTGGDLTPENRST